MTATNPSSQVPPALEKVEDRAAKFNQAHTPKRLEQHLAAWERLNVEVEEKMARYDAFFQIAQQVDDWFALIDLEREQLLDPVAGAKCLRHLEEQLQGSESRTSEKRMFGVVSLCWT